MSHKNEAGQAAGDQAVDPSAELSEKAGPDAEVSAETKTKSEKKPGKKKSRGAADDKAAKLESAEKKAVENYDRFLRISAEFENFKKRKEREAADFRKYANETLVKDLLPVVDNLQRAIETTSENEDAVNSILEGVDMTLKEIFKVLEKFAVKAVDAVGNPFDPVYHQAVMQEETAEHPENTVLKELQKGYTMHDRLLRPSMVVVSKAAPE